MDLKVHVTDPPLGAAVSPAVPVAPPTPACIAEMASATTVPPHIQTSYPEMIRAAIMALKQRDGSSSRAIAKYIERAYSNLPPVHPSLLTRHLKRMKKSGEIVTIKHSYTLPGLTLPPDSIPSPKGKPGRPPKCKTEAQPGVEALQLLSAQERHIRPTSGPVSVGVGGGPAIPLPQVASNVSPARRGPGRPKKLKSDGKSSKHPVKPEKWSQNEGKMPGRPPKSGIVPRPGVVGRPRGRPKRNGSTGKGKLKPKAIAKNLGRPPGRPAKSIGGRVPTGVGVAINVPIIDVDNPSATNGPFVAQKKRGRPPKLAIGAAGGVTNGLPLSSKTGGPLPRSANHNGIKKPRKLTGKPLGRPRKKGELTAAMASGSQQLLAFHDLQAKYENMKTRVMEIATIIKPCLNNQTMTGIAMAALHELETLGAGGVNPTEEDDAGSDCVILS